MSTELKKEANYAPSWEKSEDGGEGTSGSQEKWGLAWKKPNEGRESEVRGRQTAQAPQDFSCHPAVMDDKEASR